MVPRLMDSQTPDIVERAHFPASARDPSTDEGALWCKRSMLQPLQFPDDTSDTGKAETLAEADDEEAVDNRSASGSSTESGAAKDYVRTAHAAILRRLAAVESRVAAIGGHDRSSHIDLGKMQIVAARVAALEARLAAVLSRLDVSHEEAPATQVMEGREHRQQQPAPRESQQVSRGSVQPTPRESPRNSKGNVDFDEVQALVTRTKELLAIMGPIQESIETHFQQLQVHISQEHGAAVASLKQHVEALVDERFQQASQNYRLAPMKQRLHSQETTPLGERTGRDLTPCSFAVSSRSSSGTFAWNCTYPTAGSSSTASIAVSPLPETVGGSLSPGACQVRPKERSPPSFPGMGSLHLKQHDTAVASRIMTSAWNKQAAGNTGNISGVKLRLHDLAASPERPKEQEFCVSLCDALELEETIGQDLTGHGQGIGSPRHQSLAMASLTSLVMGAASRCPCAAWLAVARNRHRLRCRPPTPKPKPRDAQGPKLFCADPTKAGGPPCSTQVGEKLLAQQHQTSQMMKPALQQPVQRPCLPQQRDAAGMAASDMAEGSRKGCIEMRRVHI